MSRVLSYDHGPAPYKNQRKEVVLSSDQLKQLTGKYTSQKSGPVNVKQEGAVLKIMAGDFQPVLYAESANMFFLKERDLQFEFIKENNKVTKMIVHENGNIADEAIRIE